MQITKIAIITVLLTLGTARIFGQTPPTVSTRLTTDTIMLGDQIRMEVEIQKDLVTEIMVPEFKDGKVAEKVEIVGLPTIDTLKRDGRQMTLRLGYTITSFDAGVHRIESFPIVYTDRGASDTIQAPEVMELVVTTFEIDTVKQQIADIKQPLGAPLQWAEVKDIVLYSAAGAVILAILIYLLIRYLRTRRRAEKVRENEPPHHRAIRELEELAAQKLPHSGRNKEYYSRLSDIVREYLDGRYGIWAMEMTTPQIIEALEQVNDPRTLGQIKELFTMADLVKFAKWNPSIPESETSFQTAYNYVEQTKIVTENVQ